MIKSAEMRINEFEFYSASYFQMSDIVLLLSALLLKQMCVKLSLSFLCSIQLWTIRLNSVESKSRLVTRNEKFLFRRKRDKVHEIRNH